MLYTFTETYKMQSMWQKETAGHCLSLTTNITLNKSVCSLFMIFQSSATDKGERLTDLGQYTYVQKKSENKGLIYTVFVVLQVR